MTRRMLLFAALLLGIFAMHTVGHPAGDGHREMRAQVVERVSGHQSHQMGAVHAPAAPPAHRPAHDMSPLAVCLAVLGTAAVALLAALGLMGGGPSATAARSLVPRIPRTRWPWPPHIPLSRLPVLRI